jgi:N-acetylated-alpha-linked acidic dipeptidase
MLACAIACAQSDIRGFPASQADAQREREAKAHSTPDPERLRAYMQRMSAEPHIAGSPASKAVAEYAAGLLREWGLEVRIEEFEALLPYPTSRLLEMTAPVKFTAKLQEPALAEDRDSNDKDQVATYNSYAADGDVTGPLLYVNYGIPEDYEELKKL